MDNTIRDHIYVTRPSMPPLKEFNKYLEKIWDSKILTNDGPFHQQFEEALAEYLGVRHVSLFANGTLALLIALRVLNISGEVITTPFSFVATAHSLWWNNIKPVFVDIEPKTFTLDPRKIEAAITPKTTAILPVHVYGNPCKVEEIHDIADQYGLKVIYDAAHAFGVKINKTSIVSFGDLSVLSFHATKVFNTFEGGAIVCHDEKTKKRIDLLKDFGFVDETTVVEAGINAKMNEFQAAFGLLQLKYVDRAIKNRKQIALTYRKNLSNIPGIKILDDIHNVQHNYAYFPILIDKEKYGKFRDNIYMSLKKHNIYTRRYFYPLISQFPPYKRMKSAKKGLMPVAEKTAQEILCLPIYPNLPLDTVKLIIKILKDKV